MRSAFVYVVAAGDLVKIGKAVDVDRRMAALRGASPVPLTLVYSHPVNVHRVYAVEKVAHALLVKYRRHGEWFAVTHEQAIAAVKKARGMVENKRGYRKSIVSASQVIPSVTPMVFEVSP